MFRKKTIRQVLSTTDQTIVLDGGLATELERKGCNISTSLWSAEILINQPDLIKQVHQDYYAAGADVAISASYQASSDGLIKHMPGMTESEAKVLIKRSVELAKSAAASSQLQWVAKQLYVAGSIGPYGAFLADGSEYRGDYTLGVEDMKDFHRPRLRALVEAGVDILALETIPSFHETEALIQLLSEFPKTDAWISFTLKDEGHISDGTSLTALASLLATSDQVIAIGVNCIPEALAETALTNLRALTDKPLVVYPNSGEVYDATTKTWSGEHSQGEFLRDKARRWRDIGARLIGGCCRTTPESIQTVSDALKPVMKASDQASAWSWKRRGC